MRGPIRLTDNINDQLKTLQRASPKDLHEHWTRVFGSDPPRWKHSDSLVRAIAYRLQEKALGGLKAATARRLTRLANSLAEAPDVLNRVTPRVKPGTRFVREWRGDTHCVTAIDQGFTYLGKKYQSLSEVARAITGTRWSGPRFFGLRKAGVERRPNR